MPAGSKITSPKTSASLSPAVFAGVVLGTSAAGVVATVFFFNPGNHGFYPVCMFHALTGLNCPGCGMTRALYALLHGHVRLALKDNALFLVVLAGLAVWSIQFAVRKIRNRPATFKVPPMMLWLLLAGSIVFAILRNLPGFEWLSP